MAENAESFTQITDMDDKQKGNIRDAAAFFGSMAAYSKEHDMSKNAAMRHADREQEQQRHNPPPDRSRRGGLVGRDPGNDKLVGRRDLHPRGQQGTHLDTIRTDAALPGPLEANDRRDEP
jgi:hypothetical protein